MASSAPFDSVPPLALSMDYEGVAALQQAQSRAFQPACTLSTAYPRGLCDRRAVFSLEAFVPVTREFFEAPPPEFYGLLRGLVAERARRYAASDLGRMGPMQLAAWGTWLGFVAKIDVAEESLPLVGNREHRFAAIVSSDDGGIAYIGTRATVGPVVARTNAHGAHLWETVLAEPGYVETAETCVVATPDGFVAHIQAFLDRFVKLDSRGREWFAPHREIPQVDGAQLQPGGTIVVAGHIQLEHDGDVYAWSAEISADGKTLRDEIGPVQKVMTRPPF